MKKLMLMIASITLAGIAYAGPLDEGSQELGLNGLLNLDAADDFQLDLSGSYGYFIQDDIEVGLIGDTTVSDSRLSFKVGGFGEYNFRNESGLIPYIGATLQVGGVDVDGDGVEGALDEDATGLNIGGNVGVKYFINDNVAITGTFNYNWSTDDINIGDKGLDDAVSRILLGTRFYF